MSTYHIRNRVIFSKNTNDQKKRKREIECKTTKNKKRRVLQFDGSDVSRNKTTTTTTEVSVNNPRSLICNEIIDFDLDLIYDKPISQIPLNVSSDAVNESIDGEFGSSCENIFEPTKLDSIDGDYKSNHQFTTKLIENAHDEGKLILTEKHPTPITHNELTRDYMWTEENEEGFQKKHILGFVLDDWLLDCILGSPEFLI